MSNIFSTVIRTATTTTTIRTTTSTATARQVNFMSVYLALSVWGISKSCSRCMLRPPCGTLILYINGEAWRHRRQQGSPDFNLKWTKLEATCRDTRRLVWALSTGSSKSVKRQSVSQFSFGKMLPKSSSCNPRSPLLPLLPLFSLPFLELCLPLWVGQKFLRQCVKLLLLLEYFLAAL